MKDELIALAKEVGFVPNYGIAPLPIDDYATVGLDPTLERFANLVAAKEREKVAHWMMQRALATGHGDTIEDMLVELEWQIREKEREECAKVCDAIDSAASSNPPYLCAMKIRARKP